MKKLNLFTSILASSLLISACGNKHKDSAQVADSSNASRDTTKVVSGDTTKIGYRTDGVNKDDAKFAVEAASGGMAEVALGKLAQQNASNAKVKDFGAMMITDHTKANDELKALAKTKNIVLPDTPATDEQKIKADLSAKTGADFDKAYVKDMVEDHKQDIKVFEDASKSCKDPDIRAYATKTLPVLKSHLSAIESIQNSMK